MPYLEVILRHEFNCKWLLREVVPRDACGAVGRGDGEGRQQKKCALERKPHCGHLGLGPSGDIWGRAENRHPHLLDKAARREIISPECPTCCKAEVWGQARGPLTAVTLVSRSTPWGRQPQWSTDFKTHTLTPLHTHAHPHTQLHTVTHTTALVCVYTVTHRLTCTQMCAQTHTVTCAYNYMHTHGNSHMHTQLDACTHSHTYTYTQSLTHTHYTSGGQALTACRL